MDRIVPSGQFPKLNWVVFWASEGTLGDRVFPGSVSMRLRWSYCSSCIVRHGGMAGDDRPSLSLGGMPLAGTGSGTLLYRNC